MDEKHFNSSLYIIPPNLVHKEEKLEKIVTISRFFLLLLFLHDVLKCDDVLESFKKNFTSFMSQMQ